MEILIKGAKVHNLQDVTVAIPKRQWTVITGLSGSGKSSLAFDTLYAEGQRRYVESLSSYARQFMGRLDKPDVDSIEGISPAIAIEQRSASGGPRSTVATRTEIQDHLRLLFARIGRTISPVSGEEVRKDRPEDVLDRVIQEPPGTRFLVTAALSDNSERAPEQQLEILLQQGFSRVLDPEGQTLELSAMLHAERDTPVVTMNGWHLIIDRLSTDTESDEFNSRLFDSVETAFFEGKGACYIRFADGRDNPWLTFSNRFERDGITFAEPTPDLFSFNNPVGACRKCEGFGHIIGIDPNRVVPDPRLSIFEEAVACWRGERMSRWKEKLCLAAHHVDLPIHKPWAELTKTQVELIWNGGPGFKGLHAFFAHLEEKSYKIQFRVMLSRYRGRTTCTDCQGTRIGKASQHIFVGGHNMVSILRMTAEEALIFFNSLSLTPTEQQVAARLIQELNQRLSYLCDVGLGYLTLDRSSKTLSGGESQRIALSTCLGSSLVGSTYILDEPSIGLHPADTERLIGILKKLRDLGNTVVVVEHDEDIMAAADYLIDMGPEAGSHGGHVVFSGNHSELRALSPDHPSLTAAYINGSQKLNPAWDRTTSSYVIRLRQARKHNVHDVDADFPLHAMTAVTGVSGSGKSTLINEVLIPLLRNHIDGLGSSSSALGQLEGHIDQIGALEYVDQNPIGKSSRSNPVTYIKAFDEIRALFADTAASKARAYKPSHFSFNVAGGRCDTCEGEGEVTIGMQFMADLKLPCEVCNGRRFQDEVLEVKWNDKHISDILNMTVDDALEFFAYDPAAKVPAGQRRLIQKLTPLQEVGLGYIALGQSSNTLSGGEAQRIKLAAFLARGDRQVHTLFVFDEPTTGLHIHDVKKLLESFHALLVQGHSIIVIEHHLDIIVRADHIIDLGPGGGSAGGKCVFQGPPSEIVNASQSVTAQHLGPKLTLRTTST